MTDRRYLLRDEFETFERNTERAFAGINRTLEGFGVKIDSMRATDWKTLAALASLVLSVVWAFSRPYVDEVRAARDERGLLRAALNTAGQDRWRHSDHLAYAAEVRDENRRLEQAIRASSDALRDALHREMAAMDSDLTEVREKVEAHQRNEHPERVQAQVDRQREEMDLLRASHERQAEELARLTGWLRSALGTPNERWRQR